MSQNIEFPCPACGTKYSVAPHHAGKKTTCKKCGAAITVPSPQVANPTLVGGTRTIRRADIDAGSSAREAVAPDRPATAESPTVDMTGGAGVLRKEETVIGAPPQQVQRGHPGTRTGGVQGHAPRHQGHQQGRAMPPGMAPAPRKKNNLPLFAGIGGGAVAIIFIIILIVVAGGGSGTPGGGGGGGGGGVAGTGNGGTGQGGGGTEVDQEQQARERLLGQMRNSLNSAMALSLDQIEAYYEQSRDLREHAEFKSMQDSWASQLEQRARDINAERLAGVSIMLDDDGYPSGRRLMRDAITRMIDEGKATRQVMREGRRVPEAVTVFRDMAVRTGWVEYKRPREMDDWIVLAVEGASDYLQYEFRLDQTYRDVGLYPPEVAEDLKRLEKVAREHGEALFALHERDGFAINARRAWLRFKDANDQTADPNRARGRRIFSPRAMQRDNEPFDDIWTYTYWRPFIVFVEKPFGMADALDPQFMESLAGRAALLRQLFDWFTENLIDKFGLKRVLPVGGEVRGDDGTVYPTYGERAEAEGWPLEIIVLKDNQTFSQLIEDETGDRPPPGARAYYSPAQNRVVTWDDREGMDPETIWFNDSVMIHEAFHLLSDFYCANPINYERLRNQLRPGDRLAPPRARYANLLVQEGITDSVAGYFREGTGATARYRFLEMNHLRLRSWQSNYRGLENRNVFRIQDLLACVTYGHIAAVGGQRLYEMGVIPHPAFGNAMFGQLMGLYYAVACKASYFFHHYQVGGRYPYRDKWWEYLRRDYTGEIEKPAFDPGPGERAFAEVFQLRTDADWERINTEYETFIMGLNPQDVGRGYDDSPIDPSRQDNRRPGGNNQESVAPNRGSAAPGGAAGTGSAHTRREEAPAEVLEEELQAELEEEVLAPAH